MDKIIYPGSFDPITLGHVDIIKRASSICSKLIVAVLTNSGKTPFFDIEERLWMIRESVSAVSNTEVVQFDGLLADFVKKTGAKVIIKGLRAVSDYEYELQMAHVNKRLYSEMETLFMMSSAQYSFLSSSTIKEIARYGGDISEFVPEQIIDHVAKKLRRE